MSVIYGFEWNLSILELNSHEPQSSLFEKFLTDDILQFICNESVRYAQNKGSHSYKLELHDLKVFIKFFSSVDMLIYPVVLGFVKVQLMFTMMLFLQWCQETDEVMKYLHLANNTSLDPNDKFSKVWPLLNKVNEQCLSNYLPEQTVSIGKSMVPFFGRHGCK